MTKWRSSRIQVFIQIKGNNIGMKNCNQCGYRLSAYTSNFYCCNKQQAVCSSCRLNPCKKCKLRRLNIVQPTKCMVCWSKFDNDKHFKEPICGKQFCPKCLSKTFNQAFQKTLTSNRYDQFSDQSNIELPCGDRCRFNDLVSYFKDYCVQCGKEYRENLDFDLKDDLKLCFMCDSYFHDKYLNAFLKCNICGCCIQNKSKAAISSQKDLTLCRNCYNESQIEEKYLQQNKQLNESRKKSASLYKEKQVKNSSPIIIQQPKKKPQVKTNTFFAQEKTESSYVQKKFQQFFSEKKSQRVFDQKSSQQTVKVGKAQQVSSKKSTDEVIQEKKLFKKQESEASPSKIIVEKPWIPEAKKDTGKVQKKQEQRDEIVEERQQQKEKQKKLESNKPKIQQKNQSTDKPKSDQKVEAPKAQPKAEAVAEPLKAQTIKKREGSLEYFVTDKLINEEEQVDDQLKKQLGITDRLVMKKYLSDETLVENLTLQVPLVDKNAFVKCKQCNIKLPIKLAYNIDYNMDAKPQNKPISSSLLCISSIEEGLASVKTKDMSYNCRVCYQKSFQAIKKDKKSILEQSISTNDQSFRTNTSKRSIFQDSRRKSDYLRASNISHRKEISPSPNPIKISPYGLTGAKLQQHRIITQNIQNSRNQALKRPSTPIKPSHQRIRLTPGEYVPERRTSDKYYTEKCVYCGMDRKDLIHSLDGGKYCKDCYMKKNSVLFSDHSYLRNIY